MEQMKGTVLGPLGMLLNLLASNRYMVIHFKNNKYVYPIDYFPTALYCSVDSGMCFCGILAKFR